MDEGNALWYNQRNRRRSDWRLPWSVCYSNYVPVHTFNVPVDREDFYEQNDFLHFPATRSRRPGFSAVPGDLGKRIYNEISLKKHGRNGSIKQTMLINEKKLNMMNVEHRKLLEQEMINFLFEGKDVHIEGYTPES